MSELCKRGDEITDPFSTSQIQEIIHAQRRHFEKGETNPLAARKDALKAILSGLERREDEFIAALAEDLGKPHVEGWLSEIYFVKQELRLLLRKLSGWMKPRRAKHPIFLLPARSEVRRDPLGVVLVVAPWNYPLQLALSPAIGAIAAGNCVVIKPAEASPATSKLLAELIAEAVSPSLATVVTGGADTGQALLEQKFDHYFYTGGEKVGRLVAQAAARELAPCVLELGGKCPAFIDWSCDLDLAVKRIVAAKFFNAGQTCVAPDFVMVPDFLLHEFSSKLESAIDQSYGSGPPELANLPNASHWDRLQGLIPHDARQIGEDDPDQLRMAPRWAVVDWEAPCMKEEVFGPLLPIVPYPDRSACLEQLRQLPSPLALYLFSDSEKFIQEAIDRIPSGSVCVNDVMKQAINLDLPFGGVGASGHGRYRGRASFETFTAERPVTRRFSFPDPFEARPPYGDILNTLRKFLK
ncbi:aldehyde dehydrogenase family protein [Haloferula rosea]|uniref:Aldehyde dehydrogenase n=1 Tax=Haloferula rosea TaxID=490093 RepID=A0A934VAA0_9BACT|nr:aldehyde dehydrogenase family protein [Haloferula rosea]MBK1826083.1 aldehyde dehydrogenase family protein [Haloferula rosea]